MRSKSFAFRLGKLVFLICITGLIVISLVLIYLLSNGRTYRNTTPIQIPQIPGANERVNIEIAYPSFIYICVNGCRPDQNWIEFYLPSHGYREDSFRLKTSLYLGQLLTFGIGSYHCDHQDKAGYTCIKMEISHRLLELISKTL